MVRPWASLDLFSGIGGITHGLRGLARPVAYCEIDPFAQRVLHARMRDGSLPSAPVFPDVAALHLQGQNQPRRRVDIIVGGFPCQGFSNMGLRRGYDHGGSGLYHHIVRLVDELRPAALFLENVPNILRLGMDEVHATLTRRGYELRWCVLGASHLGAPHCRGRWFCLAVRPEAWPRLTRLVAAIPAVPGFDWSTEPDPRHRMTLVNDRLRRRRCGALGNAVVPDCVRRAFLFLVDRGHPLGDSEAVDAAAGTGWPRCGAATGGRRAPILRPPAAPEGGGSRHHRPLVFDPRVYRSPRAPSALLALRPLRRPLRLRHWSTPRHGSVTASNFLTERVVRDLPTQLRFELRTPHRLRRGQCNPRFLEYLMGYPPGWTDPG